MCLSALLSCPANWDLTGCLRHRCLASPYGRGAPEGGGEGPLSHGLRRDSNKLRSNCHRQLFHSIRCATHRPKGGAKGAVRHPVNSQFFAEPTGRGAQWRQYVMPTFVTDCLQAQPGRGAQGQLYLVPNVRNALAAGLARQIPIFRPVSYFTKLLYSTRMASEKSRLSTPKMMFSSSGPWLIMRMLMPAWPRVAKI